MSTATQTTDTTRAFRILGTSDEVTACDCCGKSDLKSTVALMELDADGSDLTGDAVYFGCVCAARAMRRQEKDVRRDVAAADRAAFQAELAARTERMNIHTRAWFAHLDARCPSLAGDVFHQIKALGGMAAARVGFAEPC